eukprot:5130116-Lingulodinium_polyedra.AAC.1
MDDARGPPEKRKKTRRQNVVSASPAPRSGALDARRVAGRPNAGRRRMAAQTATRKDARGINAGPERRRARRKKAKRRSPKGRAPKRVGAP